MGLPPHYTMKKILVTILILLPLHGVFADSPVQVEVLMNSAGYVTGDCDGASIYGSITYGGTYPDTSNPIVTGNFDIVCSLALESGAFSIEGGWLSGAGSTPDGNYWVKYTQEGSPYTPDYTGEWKYFTAQRSAGTWSTTGGSQKTRIVEVLPLNNATSSNPVTISAEVFISNDDFNAFGTYHLTLSYRPVEVVAQDIILYEDSITFPGSFTYSTTTDLATSSYRVTAVLDHRYLLGAIINPFGQEEVIHTFAVNSEISAFARISQNVIDNVNNAFSSTTNDVINECSNLFTSPVACLYALIIPDSQDISSNISDFKTNVLTKVPFGYGLRVYEIINATTSSSSLPALAYTFSSTTPVGLAGHTIDFTPWDKLMGDTSILGSQHADFVETAVDWFNTLWLLGFAFWLIHYVMERNSRGMHSKQLSEQQQK